MSLVYLLKYTGYRFDINMTIYCAIKKLNYSANQRL